jgi:hypothetical protein
MATSVYTSLLKKDYRRKAGEIKSLRKELRESARLVLDREKDLAALLTIIQSREPDFNPAAIKPIATIPKVLGLKWNMLTILVLDALKQSPDRPVLSTEITNHVIINGMIEIETRRCRSIVQVSVVGCLKRLLKRGRVAHCYDGTRETMGLWSLPGNK